MTPSALTETWKRLKARLLVDFPELAHDEQALQDTLDGETAAIDVIASLIRKSKEDEVMAAGLDAYINKLIDRRSRFLDRSERQRQAAFDLMQAIEVRNVTRPEFTASITAGQKRPVIVDESLLPDRCVVTKTTRRPDMNEIGRLLKDGKEVPGAVLSNGTETLRVSQR